MPIVVVEPLAEAARELHLGRLALICALDSIDENQGADPQTTGAQVTPGDPQARDVSLTLPLYGDPADSDMFEAGLRARRQARALTANRMAMRQPIYLQWDIDPEQNSWLLLGKAAIKPNQGGIAFADFNVEASGYRLANRRTHRPARYLQICDRRSTSTPRDFYGRVFTDDFASNVNAITRVVLPATVSDVIDTTGAAVAITSTLAAIDGNLSVVSARNDGEVLSFEQPEAAERRADVLILDRQGITAPTFTLTGDEDMQAAYGWEEVYGPNHPLTPGDIPTLANGLCRTRWDAANARLLLDGYVAGTGYVQQATVTVGAPTVTSVRVIAWTAEEAIIGVIGTSAGARVEIIISLRRGWAGPRVQVYSAATATIGVTPATSGTTTARKPDGTTTTAAFTGQTWAGHVEPNAFLQAPAPNLGIGLAVSTDDTMATGTVASSLFTVTLTRATWVDAFLWLGPSASIATDATAHGRASLYDTLPVPELVAR